MGAERDVLAEVGGLERNQPRRRRSVLSFGLLRAPQARCPTSKNKNNTLLGRSVNAGMLGV